MKNQWIPYLGAPGCLRTGTGLGARGMGASWGQAERATRWWANSTSSMGINKYLGLAWATAAKNKVAKMNFMVVVFAWNCGWLYLSELWGESRSLLPSHMPSNTLILRLRTLILYPRCPTDFVPSFQLWFRAKRDLVPSKVKYEITRLWTIDAIWKFYG